MKGARKFLAAAVLGLVELAAYVATDPRDLPSWAVTAALAVNAAAVWAVRNDRPTARSVPSEPTTFTRRGGYESGDTPASELRPPPRPRE